MDDESDEVCCICGSALGEDENGHLCCFTCLAMEDCPSCS